MASDADVTESTAPNDLTVLELVRLLAKKTELKETSIVEYERMGTEDIESVCAILPTILSAVRGALNWRRQVNSLPNEILAKIFAFVLQVPHFVVGVHQGICGPYQIRAVWELQSISHVCRRWRDLVFDVSALWSSAFLVSDNHQLHQMPRTFSQLSRCKAGPIRLYVEDRLSWLDPSTWYFPDSAEMNILRKYANRVDELHALIPPGWQGDTMPPSLSLPMNAIERLVARSYIGESRNATWKGRLPLLGGESLTLQSLVFVDVPFLPEANQTFPNLTHLVLSYDPRMLSDLGTGWSVRDLILFLANTPQLQEAFIRGIPFDPPIPQTFHSSLPTVHLSHLRRCVIQADLRGSSGISASLLSHLVFPPTAYVRLLASTADHIHFLTLYLSQSPWAQWEPRIHFFCDSRTISIQITADSSPGGFRVDIQPIGFNGIDDATYESISTLLKSTPLFAKARTIWASGSALDAAVEAGLVPAILSLPGVKELYVYHYGWITPEQFVDFLGALGTAGTVLDGMPVSSLDTLYLHIYDQDDLKRVSRVLRARAGASSKVRHFIAGCDDDDGLSFGETRGVSKDAIRNAVEKYVEELTIVSDDEYKKTYSLRKVLPSICTKKERDFDLHTMWPPWIEGGI